MHQQFLFGVWDVRWWASIVVNRSFAAHVSFNLSFNSVGSSLSFRLFILSFVFSQLLTTVPKDIFIFLTSSSSFLSFFRARHFLSDVRLLCQQTLKFASRVSMSMINAFHVEPSSIIDWFFFLCQTQQDRSLHPTTPNPSTISTSTTVIFQSRNTQIRD